MLKRVILEAFRRLTIFVAPKDRLVVVPDHGDWRIVDWRPGAGDGSMFAADRWRGTPVYVCGTCNAKLFTGYPISELWGDNDAVRCNRCGSVNALEIAG